LGKGGRGTDFIRVLKQKTERGKKELEIKTRLFRKVARETSYRRRGGKEQSLSEDRGKKWN